MQMNEKFDADSELPSHTTLPSHQLGGHKHGVTKLGLVKHENGYLLKPILQNEPRSLRELWFFEYVKNNSSNDPLVAKLVEFLPKYQGTWTGQVNTSSTTYLCLDDLADNYKIPCNMDVKIGAITYDPLASFQKRQREKEKYPPAERLGFRIQGMRVYNEKKNSFVLYDGKFGKQQTAATICDAFHLYLCNGTDPVTSLILSGFIHRLKAIEEWFTTQQRFAFYCSSLLFFYEGNRSLWLSSFPDALTITNGFSRDTNLLQQTVSEVQLGLNYSSHKQSLLKDQSLFLANGYRTKYEKSLCADCCLSSEMCNKIQSGNLVDVRIIDCAHVFPSEKVDSNYLFGLRNVIQTFTDLHHKILNNV